MSYLANAPELSIKINGILVGYVTSFAYAVPQGQKPTFVVDSPFPAEIAQGAAPVVASGSMTVLRPKSGNPNAWGFMSTRTGGVSGESGDVFQTVLGGAKYSTIEIVDRQTGVTMVTLLDVMFSDQQWSVAVKDIMKGSINFQARAVIDSNPNSGSLF